MQSLEKIKLNFQRFILILIKFYFYKKKKKKSENYFKNSGFISIASAISKLAKLKYISLGFSRLI